MNDQLNDGFKYCIRREYNIAKAVCNKMFNETECKKCTHNKGGKMSTRKEKTIAKDNGYHRIGTFDVNVKKQLTIDEERQFGKRRSELTIEIEELSAEKKRFDDSIKGKIAVKAKESREIDAMIYDGYRFETMHLPCFLDFKNEERVYINTETGEEIVRENMRPGDEQLSLAS